MVQYQSEPQFLLSSWNGRTRIAFSPLPHTNAESRGVGVGKPDLRSRTGCSDAVGRSGRRSACLRCWGLGPSKSASGSAFLQHSGASRETRMPSGPTGRLYTENKQAGKYRGLNGATRAGQGMGEGKVSHQLR